MTSRDPKVDFAVRHMTPSELTRFRELVSQEKHRVQRVRERRALIRFLTTRHVTR